MCTTCGIDNCGCLTVPKGDKGDKGDPGFIIIPIATTSTNSVTYVEVGRIIAGTTLSTNPFTAAKIGIYTTNPSTGSVRIRSLTTGGVYTTLYENTNITSNTVTNIESALQYLNAPLSIAPIGTAFIVIEILNQTGTAKSTFITGASLYYQ